MRFPSPAPQATAALTISLRERPFDGPEVLVFHDGPALMWLPAGDAQGRLLALALPEDAGPYPFLVARLATETAAALEAGRIDLREAFLSSSCFLLPDYGAEDLVLQPVSSPPDDWLPEAGFFLGRSEG